MKELQTLYLRDSEFVDCRHHNLNFVVSINWNHTNETLTLESITNPEIFVPENKSADLETYGYLELNPDHEDYKWRLQLTVNEKSNKIEIVVVELPKLNHRDLIIVDNQ